MNRNYKYKMKRNMKEILKNNPLITTTFEIRFYSSLESEIQFWIFYEKLLKIWFNNFIKLPINDLPESIIKNNPELKYQPRYTFEKDIYVLSIWLSSVSLSLKEKFTYEGWDNYFKEIKEVINFFNDDKLSITKIERIGLRYINFFENINIFNPENINIRILKWEENLYNQKNFLQTNFTNSEINLNLKISNNTNIEFKNWENQEWSVIDLDSYIQNVEKYEDKIINKVDECHEYLEKIFFNTITEKYLNTLK